jgi:hypothetical protein
MAQLKGFGYKGPLALEVFAQDKGDLTAPQYLSTAMQRVQKLNNVYDSSPLL